MIRTVVDRYEWIHLGLGVLGNIAFLGGSVLLLQSARTAATWMFIAGSAGMLIGNVGNVVVSRERSRERRRRLEREAAERQKTHHVDGAWRSAASDRAA